MKSRYTKYGRSTPSVWQMEACLCQLVQAGRCQRTSTEFLAHRLHVNMTWRISEDWLSFEKMAIRISLGSRFTGGRHSSSATCMSCRFGTPRDDCESFPAAKKSDSSLSRGAGELVEDVDRESLGLRASAASPVAPMVAARPRLRHPRCWPAILSSEVGVSDAIAFGEGEGEWSTLIEEVRRGQNRIPGNQPENGPLLLISDLNSKLHVQEKPWIYHDRQTRGDDIGCSCVIGGVGPTWRMITQIVSSSQSGPRRCMSASWGRQARLDRLMQEGITQGSPHNLYRRILKRRRCRYWRRGIVGEVRYGPDLKREKRVSLGERFVKTARKQPET